MSPIPQTSFLVETFFAVSYSKTALHTLLLAKAIMTLLKLDNELLILLVSSNLCPVDPESFKRSEPAKSTKLRVPVQDSLVIVFFPVILRTNTECAEEGATTAAEESTAADSTSVCI